jgi:hypothetical protein
VFRELLQELLQVPGANFCCIADGAMGKVLASAGATTESSGVPLAVLGWGVTAAGYLDAVAKDELDDLIVTSRRAYHLVRQLDGPAGELLLLYLRLDRPRANLAVARRALAGVHLRPAPVPHQRDNVRRRETPAQSGLTEKKDRSLPGAVAVAAPAETRPAQPRRHQVAALPLPRRAKSSPPAIPRARPATAAPAVPSPLPRRVAEAPPPVPVGVGGGAARPGSRWADDVGTMQRLLSALRRLR